MKKKTFIAGLFHIQIFNTSIYIFVALYALSTVDISKAEKMTTSFKKSILRLLMNLYLLKKIEIKQLLKIYASS